MNTTLSAMVHRVSGGGAGCCSHQIGWFASVWFQICFFAMTALSVVSGFLTGADVWYITGQIVLAFSAYVTLYFLSDRPLLNSVQAVVAFFYWLFGVGPTVVGLYYHIFDDQSVARAFQNAGMWSVWLVAAGLPLYGIGVGLAMRMRLRGWHVTRLNSTKTSFRMSTIVLIWLVGTVAELVVAILARSNFGVEYTSMLGGTRITIWWVGLILMFKPLTPLAISAASVVLVDNRRAYPIWYKMVSFSMIITTGALAITSGWKGALMQLAIMPVIAYVCRAQRLPFVFMAIILGAYVFVVQPFVDYSRSLVWKMRDATAADREDVFREQIQSAGFLRSGDKIVNIESPFRFVYELTGEVMRQNGWITGQWGGRTLRTGVLVVIPRTIYPGKPDLNIGNFFAKEIAVPIGKAAPNDDVHNVAITLPFEVVGNYGYIVGVLSFFFAGMAWTLFCCWFTGAPRLSSHPLTPFLVVAVLQFESPFGAVLSFTRGLIFPMIFIWCLWYLRRGRL